MKLQIWDSAGQERYKALIPSYVRGASIIFIVYDISKKSTFENINTWINFIKQVNTDNSHLVLCGNKKDLTREVDTKLGEELAKKEEMSFFEVSAKTSENINKMLYTAIAELPFFEQYQIKNKNELIEELEKINKDKNDNSIYDIVRNTNNNKGGNSGNSLPVNGLSDNNNNLHNDGHKSKKCC